MIQCRLSLLFWTALWSCGVLGSYKYEDIRVRPEQAAIQKIGKAVWKNRYTLLESTVEAELLTPETASDIKNDFAAETELTDDEPELTDISCLQCRTLIRTLLTFVEQGLTFDDIRDFAVDVCLNVSSSLGWNGEIMCEGLIDIFGPHVMWVLNETDKNAEEICQFHQNCPEEEVATTLRKSYPPDHFHAKVTSGDKLQKRKKYNKNSKSILKIAQVTDAHLDEEYTPGAPSSCPGISLCCRDNLPGTGEAGEWGEYNCPLSVPALHLMLQVINDMDVDLVINTGDTPNHGLWLETQQGQIRQSEILADGIREYIPGVPAFLTIGNHDLYPTNQYYGPSPYIKDLLHQLRLRYQDMANYTEDEIRTFEHGGYHTRLLIPGLRLMVYNSEYGYTDNYYGVLLEDSPDFINMTRWMEQTFVMARANGEKILLVSHHAQGIGFTFWHDFIADIMFRNGDLVMLHIFGHTHYDGYRMGLNEDGDAFHVNIYTTAMSSVERNPAFRIFYVDSETLTPLDFETYILNLSRPVEEGEEPIIELLYSATDDYNMPDLTPASFQDFTDRMEQDDDLYYEYRYNHETRRREPNPCEDECKKEFFCDRRTVSRYEKEACMSTY